MVINFFAAFVTGFVLAYATSWRLALAMSAMLPCIGITGAVMNKFLSGYKQYVYHIYRSVVPNEIRIVGSPSRMWPKPEPSRKK